MSMASAEFDGKHIAYPTIVSINGILVELPPDAAYRYATESGEYRDFATPEEADAYAKGSWKETEVQVGEEGYTEEMIVESRSFYDPNTQTLYVQDGYEVRTFPNISLKDLERYEQNYKRKEGVIRQERMDYSQAWVFPQ